MYCLIFNKFSSMNCLVFNKSSSMNSLIFYIFSTFGNFRCSRIICIFYLYKKEIFTEYRKTMHKM
jgi:hypothetical protein